MGKLRASGVGNLTADPEYRRFDGGGEQATIRVAFNNRYNKNGEQHEETTYRNCVFTGRMVKVIMDNLRKGSKVFVTGVESDNEWTDQSTGQKKSKPVLKRCEIEFLESRPQNQQQGYQNQQQGYQNQQQGYQNQQQGYQNQQQGYQNQQQGYQNQQARTSFDGGTIPPPGMSVNEVNQMQEPGYFNGNPDNFNAPQLPNGGR